MAKAHHSPAYDRDETVGVTNQAVSRFRERVTESNNELARILPSLNDRDVKIRVANAVARGTVVKQTSEQRVVDVSEVIDVPSMYAIVRPSNSGGQDDVVVTFLDRVPLEGPAQKPTLGSATILGAVSAARTPPHQPPAEPQDLGERLVVWTGDTGEQCARRCVVADVTSVIEDLVAGGTDASTISVWRRPSTVRVRIEVS